MMEPVEIVDGIDRVEPALGVDAVRIRDEQDGIGARPELDPLMHGRQKSRSPARLAAVGIVLAREEDDERRQVAALAAEAWSVSRQRASMPASMSLPPAPPWWSQSV